MNYLRPDLDTLLRTRSGGSVVNLENGYTGDKYSKDSKQHKRLGARLRLHRLGLPVFASLLIASALFAVQSVTRELPSAGGTLPELDESQVLSTITLEDTRLAESQGTQHNKRDRAILQQTRSKTDVAAMERCTGSSCNRAGDSDTADTASQSAQEDLPSSASGRQQQQQHNDGNGGQQLKTDAHHQGQQDGRLEVPRRKQRRKTKYTPSLKQDVDDLILEATEVARLKGIATEAEGDHRIGQDEVALDPAVLGGAEGLLKSAEACNISSCGPHGLCIAGRCQCVVMYTGKCCGHALLFSRPFLPEVMQGFSAGFEGEFVLHQGTRHKELKVYHPPNLGETALSKAYSVVANEATLQRLLPQLPKNDAVLKGAGYSNCAVVGASGSLLLQSRGTEIDSHEAVFRFNTAPVVGYERRVGSKTTHRLTNLRSWGFAEQGEVVLVHTSLPEAVEGLLWNARQEKPWKVLSLDPDFEDYMTRSFSFAPSQGLYGIIAALHVCRNVTLYGFGLSQSHGVLQRYYNPCDTPSNAQRAEKQWAVIQVLAGAGLLQLGEACVQECIVGAAKCTECRQQAGIAVPEWPVCDEVARQRQQDRQHVVPWHSTDATAGNSGSSSEAEGSSARDRQSGSR